MNKQMNLFADGGMMDNSGEVVNGVEVPPGSLKEEVADDVPARLSEGEFVIPADVVRFIGLEKLMKMRDAAKEGLARMEEIGQVGNAQEVSNPDQTFAGEEDTSGFESEIDSIMGELDSQPEGYATGGFISSEDMSRVPKNPVIDVGYYKHSDGRMMWITKINGKPMSLPPDGFTEVDAAEAQQIGQAAEKEKEQIAEKASENASGGSNSNTGVGADDPFANMPTSSSGRSYEGTQQGQALNVTIDPKTGKATVAEIPDWMKAAAVVIPGAGIAAAAYKGMSWAQAKDWNDALEKGNVIQTGNGSWVDVRGTSETGFGVTAKGVAVSSDETIAKQDAEVFGEDAAIQNSAAARRVQREEEAKAAAEKAAAERQAAILADEARKRAAAKTSSSSSSPNTMTTSAEINARSEARMARQGNVSVDDVGSTYNSSYRSSSSSSYGGDGGGYGGGDGGGFGSMSGSEGASVGGGGEARGGFISPKTSAKRRAAAKKGLASKRK